MTETDGRSKKALLVAVVLVMIAGAGAWFVFNRNVSSPTTLLAAPVAHRESSPAAATVGATTGSATTSAAVTPTATREPAAAPLAADRPVDSSITRSVVKQKPPVARDSTPKLEADLAAPAIPASVDVDAVTRGIEQSTKAKVDSAGKPRLDIKPIFKKP